MTAITLNILTWSLKLFPTIIITFWGCWHKVTLWISIVFISFIPTIFIFITLFSLFPTVSIIFIISSSQNIKPLSICIALYATFSYLITTAAYI